MASLTLGTFAMTADDKTFYQQLGLRVAQLRKTKGLTQQQLAEILGISQQTMAHYEVGRLRIAVAMLRPLANALNITTEELLEEEPKSASRKRGPASRLQQQLEQIARLPRNKQQFVIQMLDTILAQAS